ncbi:MAG: DNA repair protein RadC [Acidobacteria bacterium]|nr:DNA repair protein RadC [Acidobacteriota bacterium]MBA3886967.1 DNA repair protein RadC [Acidobacteriota bacterium]
MKTLAPHDRPREKLQRLGAAALGDNELLAIVLGHGTRCASALDLGNAVLTAFGGVHGLVRAAHQAVKRVPGIGEARAAQILAAVEIGRRTLTHAGRERVQFTTPRAAAEFLLPQYGNRPVEQFGVVLLDTKHRVLRTAVLSIGTLDASIVHPREVFREAAMAGAGRIVLFHNHPSGDPRPSDDDVRLTARMVAAGMLMGIDVIDHVILADVRYYSFREEGTFRFGANAVL